VRLRHTGACGAWRVSEWRRMWQSATG
jgi:hypothetical protein